MDETGIPLKRRRYTRRMLDSKIKAYLYLADQSDSIVVEIADLGSGGVSVMLNERHGISVDQQLRMSLPDSNGNQLAPIQVTVKWLDFERETPVAGLAFDSPLSQQA